MKTSTRVCAILACVMTAAVVLMVLAGNSFGGDTAQTAEPPSAAETPAPEYAEAVPEEETSQAPVEEAEPEPPAAVDIRALDAGSVVTAEQVAAYGEGNCFTVEEIDDELFSRMWGLSFKEDCTVPRDSLRYIRVLHVDIDGVIHVGELVMNRYLAEEVCDIFHQLYTAGYPIEKMHLVDDYGADDEASMADNNTSAFNFRRVPGMDVISYHSYGYAIDINPLYNPYVVPSRDYVGPANAGPYVDRSGTWDYKLEEGDLCYELFTHAGFEWGGHVTNTPDYQHFVKVL